MAERGEENDLNQAYDPEEPKRTSPSGSEDSGDEYLRNLNEEAKKKTEADDEEMKKLREAVDKFHKKHPSLAPVNFVPSTLKAEEEQAPSTSKSDTDVPDNRANRRKTWRDTFMPTFVQNLSDSDDDESQKQSKSSSKKWQDKWSEQQKIDYVAKQLVLSDFDEEELEEPPKLTHPISWQNSAWATESDEKEPQEQPEPTRPKTWKEWSLLTKNQQVALAKRNVLKDDESQGRYESTAWREDNTSSSTAEKPSPLLSLTKLFINQQDSSKKLEEVAAMRPFNYTEEREMEQLAIQLSMKDFPNDELDEIQAEIDRVALLAASEDEPLWLVEEVKNVTSFLEGYWNEIEQSRDRILRLKQRSPDEDWTPAFPPKGLGGLHSADSVWRNTTDDELRSADSAWRNTIDSIRCYITREIVKLSCIANSYCMDAKLPCLFEVQFEDKKMNSLALTIQVAANLRKIIEKFLRVFGEAKETLLAKTRRIEFEGAFEELEQFEEMSSDWTSSAKLLKKYLSTQLEKIQEFQKTKIVPLEQMQSTLPNLALKDEENIISRLMKQIKFKAGQTRNEYKSFNDTMMSTYKTTFGSSEKVKMAEEAEEEAEYEAPVLDPAPEAPERLEDNEEYQRNKAEIEALKAEKRQLEQPVMSTNVMPWITEAKSSVGREYINFFENFKTLTENIKTAKMLEHSAKSFEEMQRHNRDALEMLELWYTVADGMRDNMRQFTTAMTKLNEDHKARVGILESQPGTSASSAVGEAQPLLSPVRKRTRDEPRAIGILTVENNRLPIYDELDFKRTKYGNPEEKRLTYEQLTAKYGKGRDYEIAKMMENERKKEQEATIKKFCDRLVGTWTRAVPTNCGPKKIVIKPMESGFYEDTHIGRYNGKDSFEWCPDNVARDGVTHYYEAGKLMYQNKKGDVHVLYRFLFDGDLKAGCLSGEQWKQFVFKKAD